MPMNEDDFNVLATLRAPIDCVIRCHETYKLDFPGTPFIETKLTERYGYQVVLGAYGEPGKWPIQVVTEYRIQRPRIEIAVPASYSLVFLKDLRRNLSDEIKRITHWEKMRLLK